MESLGTFTRPARSTPGALYKNCPKIGLQWRRAGRCARALSVVGRSVGCGPQAVDINRIKRVLRPNLDISILRARAVAGGQERIYKMWPRAHPDWRSRERENGAGGRRATDFVTCTQPSFIQAFFFAHSCWKLCQTPRATLASITSLDVVNPTSLALFSVPAPYKYCRTLLCVVAARLSRTCAPPPPRCCNCSCSRSSRISQTIISLSLSRPRSSTSKSDKS